MIGGEQPLSIDEAALWLDANPGGETPGRAILQRLGCRDGAALWLRYGRSALGLGLRLAGAAPGGTVALPDYQCDSVVEKIIRVAGGIAVYPVNLDLTPSVDAMLDAAAASQAIVTCAYYGSPCIDASLGDASRRIFALPNRPWIIEDRAMAFPDAAGLAAAAGRCDFLVLTLRKIYPVPDGAVLVACSERAAAVLSRWKEEYRPPDADAADRAVRAKVLAKVKRHDWISAAPMADRPADNAVVEADASEALVNAVAGVETEDGLPGSAGSEAYVLRRELDADFTLVKDRSRRLTEALPDLVPGSLPLPDCAGIAIPMLIDERSQFLGRASADGIFLSVHWPRHPAVTPGAAARRWYEQAVSFPLLPARPDADIAHLLSRLRG